MNTKISDSIVSVGVDDPDEKIFENQYALPFGVSYNSYAILGGGDEIAVMDSVEGKFGDQWIREVEHATGGRAPRWLIVQHAEPDHSACISSALDRWPDCKVVASAKCLEIIGNFHIGVNFEGRTLVVKEGDTLEVGSHRLHFLTAPMIHWPEVIMTYDETDKVLFTADGFGRFGSLQDDETDWADEARRYYCNIVGKFGQMVQNLLKKASKLDIEYIAPLHGPVLKAPLDRPLDLYNHWSTYTPECPGVLVAYASIYGNTAACALRLAEMLRERGENVYTADLTKGEPSEAVAQAFRFDTMVLAASSYDGGVFPPMRTFLDRIASKGLRNRRVGLIQNGSWAPVAASVMRKALEGMTGMDVLESVVTIRSTMSDADLPALSALADTICNR